MLGFCGRFRLVGLIDNGRQAGDGDLEAPPGDLGIEELRRGIPRGKVEAFDQESYGGESWLLPEKVATFLGIR
jgi:hypothetical protein